MRPATNWLDALPSDRLLAELSLWSADLGHLAEEISRVDAISDIYHIDVADGSFSPTLLFFPDLVAMIRCNTGKPLHVHLMAADNILVDQINQFAEAGADLISIHSENRNIEAGLDAIEKHGLVAGIVLQLHTPVNAAEPYFDRLGMLTLLGTRIGVKGQGLNEQAESRIREARVLIDKRASANRILLAADGAIREHTVPGLRQAGTDTVVMGSLCFEAPDLTERMTLIHSLLKQK